MNKLDNSLLAPLPPFRTLEPGQIRDILDLAAARRYEYEVGVANLGMGLSAIAAALLGIAAAWAVFLMAASFLWGAAFGHVRDMVKERNFAINNAGPIFWWDILTPLTLLIGLLS